jgi:hypothetical protein
VTPDQKAHTPTGNANDVIVLTAVKLLSSFTFLHHQLANVFFVPPAMQGSNAIRRFCDFQVVRGFLALDFWCTLSPIYGPSIIVRVIRVNRIYSTMWIPRDSPLRD